jgi:hypothetical protein
MVKSFFNSVLLLGINETLLFFLSESIGNPQFTAGFRL